MNKLLILGARMRNKADEVVELEKSIKKLNKRSELEAAKLEQAGNDEEVSAVEKNLEEIQKELDEKKAEKEQLEKKLKN
jgi:chromosome segregation ATPase